MWKFHEARQYYEKNRNSLLALAEDEQLGPVVRLLIAEEPYMESSRRHFWLQRLRYRFYSFRRRNRSGFEQAMFHVFEIGGRTISELRDPTVSLRRKCKRAAGAITETLRPHLVPGDIIVSRHQDALTNRFLPGFWPHASLFIGSQKQGGEVVEARKDGVKLRPLTETLAVDAFLVLRKKVSADVHQQVVKRALSHVGKLYDFAFDFRQADRLACTAVVYRCWHELAGVRFCLGEQSGRLCLPADDLIAQAIAENDFQLAAYFGPREETVLLGDEAQKGWQRDRGE